MATFDTSVLNGTCWWRAGAQAGSDFIPCGNAFAPNINFQCCSHGDTCFNNGACFNPRYGSTYLAGCTDPTYNASECQNKGNYSDQQWNGLVTCSTAIDQNAKSMGWAGCLEQNLDHLTDFSKGCKCNATNPALFTDYPIMISTAILPLTIGGSLLYLKGYSAPTVSTISPTSLASSASSTITSATTTSSGTFQSSSVEPQPTAAPTNDQSLSTGAKAGIGAGVTGGVFILGIIGLLFWLLRRHKRQNENNNEHELSYTLQHSNPTAGLSSVPMRDSHSVTSGFKEVQAELAGDHVHQTTSGTFPASPSVSPLSATTPHSQAQPRRYEAYNPGLHGNYSQHSNRDSNQMPQRGTTYSSVFPVSPQHTGASQQPTSGTSERHEQWPMAPIAELQG